MSKIRSITIMCNVFILLLIFASCSGGLTPESSTLQQSIIQGTLDESVLHASARGGVSRSAGSSEDGITGALLFYGNRPPIHAPIIDSKFVFSVETTQPAGIVFIGTDNTYKGYLSADSNLESNALPLQALANNPRNINLGQLTLPPQSGNGAGHKYGHNRNLKNDLGIINSQVYDSFVGSSALFSSIIANPDFDNNGVLDILESKRIRPTFLFYFGTLGTFNDDFTPTLNLTGGVEQLATQVSYKIIVQTVFDQAIQHTQLTWVEPEIASTSRISNPVPDNVYTQEFDVGDSTRYFQVFWFPNPDENNHNNSTIPGFPAPGTHKIIWQKTFDPDDPPTIGFDVHIPTTIEERLRENIILIVPTVTISNGIIQSVSWQARNPDGSLLPNPEMLISDIELQIDHKTAGRWYDSGNVPGNVTSHRLQNSNFLDLTIGTGEQSETLPRQAVWDDVGFLFLAYNDLFGNHYVIQYQR